MGGTATFNGPVTAGPGSISGGATFNHSSDLGVVTLTGSGSFDGVGRVSGLHLSGTLAGTNVVTITNLTWTGGYMTGVGQTVVASGGSLWIDRGRVKYLSQRVLSNQGAAVWTNTGALYGYYGAVVNNSGTWDMRSDATFRYYSPSYRRLPCSTTAAASPRRMGPAARSSATRHSTTAEASIWSRAH